MINKTIDMGGGYRLMLKIDNGIATMTSNYAKALLKIYWKTKTDNPDKILSYDYRRNVMIEKFKISDEEYSKKIDGEIGVAKTKQKEAIKDAETRIKDGQKEEHGNIN